MNTTRNYHWRNTEVKNWNKHHMYNYIWDQQDYMDGYGRQVTHSKEDLMRDCGGDVCNARWQQRFSDVYDYYMKSEV